MWRLCLVEEEGGFFASSSSSTSSSTMRCRRCSVLGRLTAMFRFQTFCFSSCCRGKILIKEKLCCVWV